MGDGDGESRNGDPAQHSTAQHISDSRTDSRLSTRRSMARGATVQVNAGCSRSRLGGSRAWLRYGGAGKPMQGDAGHTPSDRNSNAIALVVPMPATSLVNQPSQSLQAAAIDAVRVRRRRAPSGSGL